MRATPIMFLITVLTLAVSAARADDQATAYDPKTAFAESDKNGDGVIDHRELYERVVDVFYRADANKDGFLSVEEFYQLPFPGDFKGGDRDGDGRVSLREFVRLREQDFDAADTDQDEVLSLEEVITVYEGKKKK